MYFVYSVERFHYVCSSKMCLFFTSFFTSPSLPIPSTTPCAKQPTPNPSSFWKETGKQTKGKENTSRSFISLFCYFWGVTASSGTARESLQMSRLKINETLVVKTKGACGLAWRLDLKSLFTQSDKKGIEARGLLAWITKQDLTARPGTSKAAWLTKDHRCTVWHVTRWIKQYTIMCLCVNKSSKKRKKCLEWCFCAEKAAILKRAEVCFLAVITLMTQSFSVTFTLCGRLTGCCLRSVPPPSDSISGLINHSPAPFVISAHKPTHIRLTCTWFHPHNHLSQNSKQCKNSWIWFLLLWRKVWQFERKQGEQLTCLVKASLIWGFSIFVKVD